MFKRRFLISRSFCLGQKNYIIRGLTEQYSRLCNYWLKKLHCLTKAGTMEQNRMSLKRKRVVLSLRDKVDVIESLLKGESGTTLARKYGVGSATISDIKKNRESILKFVSALDNGEGSWDKKTMKTAENISLDVAVYNWYLQRKINGEPVSGPMICEKALELNKEMKGDPEFKASTGWLTRFKIRHNIRFQEENMSADKFVFPSVKDKVEPNAESDVPEIAENLFMYKSDQSLGTPASGLKAEYRAGLDSLQKNGGLRTNSRFFHLLDKVLGKQSATTKLPQNESCDKSSVVAVLELPHQDGNGPTIVSEEFVVDSQDQSDSDEDDVSDDVANGSSSRTRIESCPIQIKVEYDPDEAETEAVEPLEADEPESSKFTEPEPSVSLFNEKSSRKRKSTVKQIEDILNRVLDNSINKFIAFEQAMDKRAREETNSFRSKLLAIERRKLEETSTQTFQNERIINLMEALVSQQH